tara:strand:- start:1140 stop:1379 length:240 start_codon:yes stop_codon:yes gene_type:complete
MIINQVSKQGRQAFLVVGELVPIEDSAYVNIWNIIVAYKTCHDHLLANCGHRYTIEVNGIEMPSHIKNEDQLREWIEYG